MKILLSPAKSMNELVEVPNIKYTYPVFAKEAISLASKLAKMNTTKIMNLMGVSPNIAALNVERYQNFALSTNQTDSIKPAAFLFSGEVYRGLDIESLNIDGLQRAQQKIRILSGLYGLLKPLDLIFPYRLEMGTPWEITPKTKNLYAYWGNKILKELQVEMHENETIVNLSSAEYYKAIPKNERKNPVLTPIFKEFKAGKYSVVMMHAKHARGAMARYLIEHDLQDIHQLKNFNVLGYSFDTNLSSEHEWVFTR